MSKIKTLTFEKVRKFKTSPNSDGPIIINTKNGDKEVYKVGVVFQELDSDDMWYATCWDKEESDEWNVEEGDEKKVKLEPKYTSWSFPSKQDRVMAMSAHNKDKIRQLEIKIKDKIMPALKKMMQDNNGLEDDLPESPDTPPEEAYETDDEIDPNDIPF